MDLGTPGVKIRLGHTYVLTVGPAIGGLAVATHYQEYRGCYG